MIYQTFFANKNETFIKFIKEKMEPLKYFQNFNTILEEKFDDNSVMLCCHPHNIMSLCVLGNINFNIPNFKILGSRMALSVPVLGIFLKFLNVKAVNP